jgi:hypothetical protein
MVANSKTHQYDVFEDVYVFQESNKYDIYSFFPYEGGRCGDNLEAVLVNQCYSENAVELANNIDLFPNKGPTSFAGCSVAVLNNDKEPYEININKNTDLYQSTGFKFRGLKREYLRLATDVMKMEIQEITENICSISVWNIHGVCIALQNAINNHIFEASIPYIFDAFKWYVPCTKSVLKMERILAVFNLSVWLTVLSVVLITGLVFWFSAKCSYRSVVRESHSYKTVIRCMCNVWCIMMGVPVSEMPRTSRVRAVFCLFVCFSFATSTIFQSFFMYFLVSQSSLKPLTTLENLKNSTLKYGKNDFSHRFLTNTGYKGFEGLNLEVFECPDIHKCLERLFTQGDIAVVSRKIEAEYVASQIDLPDGKLLCSLDEDILVSNQAMYVFKGDPIVGHLNVLLRRIMEAGLVDKIWSEFIFGVELRNTGKTKDVHCKVCKSNFDVFSLSHLKVAFLVLGFGHALSATVFLAEILCKYVSASVTKNSVTPFSYIH